MPRLPRSVRTVLRRGAMAGLVAALAGTGAARVAAQTKKPKPELRLKGEFAWGGAFDSGTGAAIPGATRTGRWFPIWIEVENKRQKEAFDGIITIQPRTTQYSADRHLTIQARVAVPPKSKVRVRLVQRIWSLDPDDPITYSIEARDSLTGRVPLGGALSRVPMPNTVRERSLCVVVGKAPAAQLVRALRFMARPLRTPMVAPEALPERFAGLDAVDVLVWPRCEGDPCSDAQLAALYQWVRAGGTLIVGVGTSMPGPRVTTALLPAGVGGAVTVPALTTLPVDPDGGFKRDTPEKLYPLTPAQRAGTTTRFLNTYTEPSPRGPVPWVVQRRQGAGTVVMVGADLTAKPFREAASRWWMAMAQWPPGAPGPSPSLPPTKAWENQPLQFALARGIADVKPAAEVPFGWLALFLGAYVALIGPIDYWILRRLNRLEWTFATFTVVTVVVTGAAWIVSQYLKGGEMLLRAIEIRTGRANVDGGRVESVFGIYANTHSDLVVTNANDTAATGLFWVPEIERRGAAGRTCDIAVSKLGVWTTRAPVRIWTTDWFHSVWSDARPAVVSGTLREVGDAGGAVCAGELTLNDDRDWREVYLVYGSRILPLGEWRAGRKITVKPDRWAQVDGVTRRWETVPDTDGEPPAQYAMEKAARNVMAASVGRIVGVKNDLRAYHPWTESLAVRPPPGTALLLAVSDGGHESLVVPEHDPQPEGLRVERVWIPVRRGR